MVDDARLDRFRTLWTEYLDDYVLIHHPEKDVICNRETQLPLMIEDDIRDIVTQKFIDAGVERIYPEDDD
jgi:hypothetical protein